MLDIASLMSALSKHRPIFHRGGFSACFCLADSQDDAELGDSLRVQPVSVQPVLVQPKGIFRHSKDLSESQGF